MLNLPPQIVGDVTWVNRSTAAASPKLVETTASGNTILRVVGTTDLPPHPITAFSTLFDPTDAPTAG